jgi:hypothetical protein
MDYSIGITWLLFLAIWLVPICAREFRNSAQLMLAYWFVIVLHQAVAFTNAFLFPTIAATNDALSFHNYGMAIAESGNFTFPIGDIFYRNMLGVVYWIFGPSIILAQQLSVLAFSISCVVLVKILCQLELYRYRVPILLAFGTLPTVVLLSPLTLRESYEVLFFMLAVYFGLKMHITRSINPYLLFMSMTALGMGVLHRALSVYAFCLIILFILWKYQPASHLLSVKKLRLMSALVIPALILGIPTFIARDSALSFFLSGNMELLDYMAYLREHMTLTRATYGVSLDLSSPFATFSSSLMLYAHYLFAPFPWKINNAIDAYASIESLLRLVLICFALKNWHNAYGAQRRVLGLMLILFFSMTFLWAVGTTNYGTSIRHHMLTWWILVITGLPLLMETLNRALLGFPIRIHKRF